MKQTPELISGDCSECPIRHRAVCSRCEPEELDELEQLKYYRTYKAGQTIAVRGDDLTTVSSVVTGTATLSRVMEDGRTQIVGLLLPSDFIGRPGRTHAQYDIQAISDVTLCCFRRAPFEQMVTRTPHVSERMLEMALDELDAARDWMLLLGRKTAREKVASFLLLIQKRSARPGGEELGEDLRLELPLTREVMATYLGLTIETVSRQLTALRKDGVIDVQGKKVIVIKDLIALMMESGDDDDGGILD
ncbi:Crp/Fnr family transcriptional regulator [Aliishimia ponticola]|uniref:Crp/Fnr family transcriptional regulator n=1 Tax=Aliishimia ponticola TaxID=2499833 RepID=A0A4S4N9E7_9RHOB|nr:Crp/Fnr family transcriptional regulator [Aliishimia ponticola]THH35866.1 Crp/Fnr family transcriptional regulator [Aliishimia ponticola]